MYIWFDYIGVHNKQICFSDTGLVSATNKGVVLILDFWAILENLTYEYDQRSRENYDYYEESFEKRSVKDPTATYYESDHRDIFIAKDYINFVSRPNAVTIWSFGQFYDQNKDELLTWF